MADEYAMSAVERAAYANGFAAAESAAEKQIDDMRGELREVRDGLRIMLLLLQRLEGMMTGQQPQLSALHQWMSGLSDRVRRMEHGEGVS
jgi:hypothetical protein